MTLTSLVAENKPTLISLFFLLMWGVQAFLWNHRAKEKMN